ncbi:MAG: 2-oxoglutarate dehydrogenase complex dihydrolipoyllysine-residue succinyltransferase [Gammaproteobacteria bacterium]|nr:2-oxoglutarate dehydrogenase complex dihydrolipoyllysine-residue succinyltransferase [Gammaproteobacteria bacterium]
MLVEVKVPVLAESISEATLANWHKSAGDYVREEENLVDLETDKVMLEVVAPHGGVLKEIKKGDGTNVVSDEVIAVIDTAASNADAADREHTNAKPAPFPEPYQVTKISEHPKHPKHALSPAVRKLIADNRVDVSKIIGTGKDGRITKADVLKYLGDEPEASEEADAEPVRAERAPPQSIPTTSTAKPAAYIDENERPEKRVPMSRLRSRVAERLKDAQNTAAILTTFNEVNMKPVMDLRNKYKQTFEKRHGVKLGFMSFFVKAVVDALKQFPIVNASVEATDIIYHGYFDVGIAVSSPRGLVVPILRDADQMSFADIESAIAAYGEKARDNKLEMEDLLGGTFSISNGGIFGSMLSTPILNPPQSAILGMHNIKERPVVENGEIVVRPIMYLALSYDHRIIDGRDAVLFLVSIKEALEDPTRMLLDV